MIDPFLAELEGGWFRWLKYFFPQYCHKPFSAHQIEFWDWVWSIEPDSGGECRVLIWPRGHSKCYEEHTEVLKADGTRVAIKDISIGESILSFNQQTNKIEIDRVANKWDSGTKECVSILTRSGKRVDVSLDHRMLTFEGWKEARYITKFDRIASPRFTPTLTTETRTNEEIRLLAYMIAEGSCSSGNSGFTNADRLIVDDFHHCAKAMGIGVSKGPRYSYRMVGGRPWLKEMGLHGHTAYTKRVPDWVFRLSPEQKWQFIGALIDTDGYIDIAQDVIGIALANPLLIEDIGYILLQLGVVTIVCYKHNDKAGAWELRVDKDCLQKCKDNLPLILKHERLAAVQPEKRYSLIDTYPREVARNLPKGVNRLLRDKKGIRAGTAYEITRKKMRRLISFYPNQAWVDLEASEVFWDQVLEVEPIGQCDTFDVEVEKNHSLIAGGLIGHNSTSVEMAIVALACRRKRKFAVYLSGTQEQANYHLRNIQNMFESPTIKQFYPEHSEPKLNNQGYSLGWSVDRLTTSGGFVVQGIGLEKEVRGIKVNEERPDLVAGDDIDRLHESAGSVQKKIEIVTESIIPIGTANKTITMFVQNLIHDYSFFSRLADPTTDFLAYRKVSGPYVAVEGLEYEPRKGKPGYQITAGRATWEGLDLAACQAKLDESGLRGFLREFQNDVSGTTQNALLSSFKPTHHLITRSAFRKYFGIAEEGQPPVFTVPMEWERGRGLDWGTTPKHPTVCSYIARPSEAYGLTDCLFWYREFCLPTYPPASDEPELVWPGKVAKMLNLLQKASGEIDVHFYISVMSHEQPGVKNTFVHEMPEGEKLSFVQWKPNANAGLAQMQEYLAIDESEPHPFNVYPEGHEKAGQPLQGRPRMYFICEDEQAKLYMSGKQLKVSMAKNSEGFARARFEIPRYRKKIDVGGVEGKEAEKIDDDWVDSAKGILEYFGPRVGALPVSEVRYRALPKTLTNEAIAKIANPEQQAMAWMSQQLALAKMEKAEGITPEYAGINWQAARRDSMENLLKGAY